MTLASWLLLIKTAKIHPSYFFKILRCLTAKTKLPHRYANHKDTLNTMNT